MSTATMPNEIKDAIEIDNNLPFANHVKNMVNTYYKNMVKNEGKPENVYDLIMSEIELPLIQSTMTYTNNNQYRSAKILGLNRGTFRKKLKYYGML